MAKHPPAVYAPGELDRTRKNLGSLNPEEAKRIAGMLGGEVGVERSSRDEETQERVRRNRSTPRGTSSEPRSSSSARDDSGRSRRLEPPVEEASDHDRRSKPTKRQPSGNPEDDPSVPFRISYRERVRMDRLANQPEHEIKSGTQVLISTLAILGEPPDAVNPRFTVDRMNEHFSKLELLVRSVRTLLPRTNVERTTRFEQEYPFQFRVINVLRYWKIERISAELGRLQSRPRDVMVRDYGELLRLIYGPLYVLGLLDQDSQVRGSIRTLFRAFAEENGGENKERPLAALRDAVATCPYVFEILPKALYPLLLKICSDRLLSYDELFQFRRRRVESFLAVKHQDRIAPPPDPTEEESLRERPAEDVSRGRDDNVAGGSTEGAPQEGETQEAVSSAESNAAESSSAGSDSSASGGVGSGAQDAARQPGRSKALSRSLDSMEALFPRAGWERLHRGPDLYPYFSGIFEMKNGPELVSPTDPLHQVLVLIHILEELFFGLRYIRFGTITDSDGSAKRLDEEIGRIIGTWHDYYDRVLEKEYFPRLVSYVRQAQASGDPLSSKFARRTLAEINWIKRLYFLPYLSFESELSTHPYRDKSIPPLYSSVKDLRRYLTAAAAGIDAAVKRGASGASGAAAARIICDGIDNPWDIYEFQVPNPVSERLDALLGGKTSTKRTNAALIFFTLSAATVLDTLVNDAEGYAYKEDAACPFRSIKGEGRIPLFGVDAEVDADAIFRKALQQKRGG